MPEDLSGLHALLAVVDKRSFTGAALALRVTPSAVSQSVRALEERVGVRLLQRSTRSVGLTEAGERFVARLRPALADVQAAFAALGELRDEPSGLLRLNVPRLGFNQILEPHLAAFLAAYPKIQLDLVLDDGFVSIIEQGFDAGVRIGEMVERDMVAMRIGQDERAAIVGSPAYFSVRGKPKHPRELQQHDCINYRRISSGEVYRWEFTDKGREIEIAVSGRLVVNDLDAMLSAACRGIGLAYMFESTVREQLASGALVRVLDSFCPPFPGFYLYYPSRAQLAAKQKALIDFLKARTAKQPARKKPR
jgi:DNA-binding transcriptional LysR family regulator